MILPMAKQIHPVKMKESKSMLNLPTQLPIARYRFTFRCQNDWHMPVYAGSTLRGIFGHALLATVCVCGQREQHSPNCPYSHIFTAPPNAQLHRSLQNTPPQPYVFEPPLNGKTHYRSGENYVFHLVLFGQSRLLLSLIVSAMKYAFQHDTGKTSRIGQLCDLAIEHNQQWHSIQTETGYLLKHSQNIMLQQTLPMDWRMTLHTPLRIQQHQHIVKADHLSPEIILRQSMRRVSAIAQLYFDQPLCADYSQLSALAQTVQGEINVRWQDWQRYSNRQQTNMKLGGLIGECILRDVPAELAALLFIGQWTHIGKETVFGLGAYTLQAA